MMIPFGIYSSYLLNKDYDFNTGECVGHYFCENNNYHIALCSGKSYSNILLGCETVGFMSMFVISILVLPFILVYKLFRNIGSIVKTTLGIFVTTIKIISIVSMIAIIAIPAGILSSYMFNYDYVYSTGKCVGYWFCFNTNNIIVAVCHKETYARLIFGCTYVGGMAIITVAYIFAGIFVCCKNLYSSTKDTIKEVAISIEEVNDIESAIEAKRSE